MERAPSGMALVLVAWWAATVGAQRSATQLLFKFDAPLGVASLLLPRGVRDDWVAVYAWCRRADEAVDDARTLADARAMLAERRAALDDLFDGHPRDDLDALLLATCRRRPMDRGCFDAMLRGMELDAQESVRFATWADLDAYCYDVAGTVGEMLLPLMALDDERRAAATPGAVALGKAIQLANIARDVRKDAEMGRLYLPLEELSALGVDEAAFDASRPSLEPAARRVVAQAAARARRGLAEGSAAVELLPGAFRPAVIAIIRVYAALVDDLEAKEFDPYASNVRVRRGLLFAVAARAALPLLN